MKLIEVKTGRKLVGAVRKGVGYISSIGNVLSHPGGWTKRHLGALELQPSDVPVYNTSRVTYDCMSESWEVETPGRVQVGWHDPDRGEFRQLKGAPILLSVQKRPVATPGPDWVPVYMGDQLVLEISNVET